MASASRGPSRKSSREAFMGFILEFLKWRLTVKCLAIAAYSTFVKLSKPIYTARFTPSVPITSLYGSLVKSLVPQFRYVSVLHLLQCPAPPLSSLSHSPLPIALLILA